ncbi:hypothetical protein COOONC_14143 [Cooperia oncophora]
MSTLDTSLKGLSLVKTAGCRSEVRCDWRSQLDVEKIK